MKHVKTSVLFLVMFAICFVFCVLPVKAESKLVTEWTGTEGDLYIKHEHTVGEGIPVIIMGVHFGSEDLAAGGRLQVASDWATEVLLDTAPNFFEGFEDYLDIYVYIGSEEVHPVPTDGYVESYWDKWATACGLAEGLLGKDGSQIRMVYLGNSDNTDQSAGQVGGWAFGGSGAMLSWGVDASGNAWQGDPAYWARHEFFGHGFAGFADEYYQSGVSSGDTNLFISETKPDNAVLPWYDFIGYKETHNEVEYEIGVYTYEIDGYKGWFPVKRGFMHDANPYISQYHKWIVYKTAMEIAGSPKTLDEYCAFAGITLNPPAPETVLEEVSLAARDGGTVQLSEDLTLNGIQFTVAKDFILDLNGHSLTSTLNIARGAAFSLEDGVTFTVNDSAGGGKLTVKSGGGAGIMTTYGTFVVNGGTLDIEGGNWSAAIGGHLSGEGASADGGNIIINGGIINAKGGNNQAAAIGGGSGGNAGNITINGGTINAVKGTNALSDIGCGAGGGTGNIKITGGSVNAAKIYPAPTNGSVAVYKATITLEGFPYTQVTSGAAQTYAVGDVQPERAGSSNSYGTEDVETDGDSNVYFWLPEGENEIALVADGVTFVETINVKTDNSSAAVVQPTGEGQIVAGIKTQPADVSVAEGKTAEFKVVASGYPTPTYQWQVSADDGSTWTDISGAISAKYTISNVTVASHHGKQYRCVVKNTTEQENVVTSAAVKLTVTASGGSGSDAGSGTSGSEVPDTGAADARNVLALIFIISTLVFGVAVALKNKKQV